MHEHRFEQFWTQNQEEEALVGVHLNRFHIILTFTHLWRPTVAISANQDGRKYPKKAALGEKNPTKKAPAGESRPSISG